MAVAGMAAGLTMKGVSLAPFVSFGVLLSPADQAGHRQGGDQATPTLMRDRGRGPPDSHDV